MTVCKVCKEKDETIKKIEQAKRNDIARLEKDKALLIKIIGILGLIIMLLTAPKTIITVLEIIK